MRRRRWRPDEITTIVQRFTKEGPKLLAQELGRSEKSISSQARRYGQKTPRRSYQRLHSQVSYADLLLPN